jgi:MarR family transcriptional regulator, organic hydroperoxide resistance regulator
MAEDSINQSISLVSKIHSQTADFLVQKFKEKGMPDFASSHGNILFQLSKNESMTMKELSQKINRDKSTTTVLVRKLICEGLVTSVPDKNDRRSLKIQLTEKGREYNICTAQISEELIETFYKNFTEEEKQKFFEFLKRAADNFA